MSAVIETLSSLYLIKVLNISNVNHRSPEDCKVYRLVLCFETQNMKYRDYNVFCYFIVR